VSAGVGERSEERAATDFVPGVEVRVPSGAKARARANLDGLAVLNQLDAQDRPATPAEQDTLARWSGWGAVPQIFETHRHLWAGERESLREVLTEDQYREAAATTMNDVGPGDHRSPARRGRSSEGEGHPRRGLLPPRSLRRPRRARCLRGCGKPHPHRTG